LSETVKATAPEGTSEDQFAIPEVPLNFQPRQNVKEELYGFQDFDLNLCSSAREVQRNSTKCFERQLELVSLSYFGPPSSTGFSGARKTPESEL
tara:strand:- start:79 stop:360 length:282 start_codon:yes stop_codon:yes gene_type:complete